jgi:hypothetical protein
VEKWIPLEANKGGRAAFDRYLRVYGRPWVVTREIASGTEVRLKTLEEFRPRFEVPGKFMLLAGEELSDRHKVLPLHLNAYNLRELIPAQGGTSVVDVLQRNVDAVLEQSRRTGQPMIPHVNHPNFGYGITAEELMQIRGERFFEVYNGHPDVHNEGDAHHPGTERMWDIMLAFRLTTLNLGVLYGLAVDDSHAYHVMSPTNSNPGRGWIMVRSSGLTPESLLQAMEAGDFYGSSGVILDGIQRLGNRIQLDIRTEPGIVYTTRFIGTRRGFNATSQAGRRPPGGSFPVTRQYSDEIGVVLAEVTGPRASYEFEGDELYVRARVGSTKAKANPYRAGETEAAWVQPMLP